MAEPETVAVKVTEQVPLTRVHEPGLKVPEPAPLTLNVTVPPGVVAPAPLVSVTVAVHMAIWVSVSELGVHITPVDVVLKVLLTDPMPVLVLWFESPP